MSSETELLNALWGFEPTVTVDGSCADAAERVIARNPKLAFYVAEISSQRAFVNGVRITYRFRYVNTEVPPSDVHVVSTPREVNALFCQYADSVKPRLVLFAGAGTDVVGEWRRFVAVNAPYYANFLGAEVVRGQSCLTPLAYYDFHFQYRMGRVKLAMMENETRKEVERIAGQLFLSGMSDATKAFLAHNYLAHTIEYTRIPDPTDLEAGYMQSAYGGLIRKKCVCQGYAEAFKRLMNHEGIPCDMICGQIAGSSTHHAWNILRLNGGRDCYHVDVTWDSTESRVSCRYFGLSDGDLAVERRWNRELYPRCAAAVDLLTEARRGLPRFMPRLAANGVGLRVLGF